MGSPQNPAYSDSNIQGQIGETDVGHRQPNDEDVPFHSNPGDHQEVRQPTERKSNFPKVYTIEPDRIGTGFHRRDGTLEPVRLHIKLNHNTDKSDKKHREKKRSKYSCRKCVTRFRSRALLREHLISHVGSIEAKVLLTRLRLPDKLVIRASRYYARKYPVVPVVDPANISIGPGIRGGPLSSKLLTACSNKGLSYSEITKPSVDAMANPNNAKSVTSSASMEGIEESRGKEVMEELGIQMNKLAGSFFRHDMQTAAAGSGIQRPANSGYQIPNSSSSPHFITSDHKSPPPLMGDGRTAVEIPASSPDVSSVSQPLSSQLSTTMAKCGSTVTQTVQQQQQQTHVPSSSCQSPQLSRGSSPLVLHRSSPHSMSSSSPIAVSYRVPSPQSNVPTSPSNSARISPRMTPPPNQRSPHLPLHMQGPGNAPHRSPQPSCTPPSQISSMQSLAPSTIPAPPNIRPTMVMNSNNVPNDRCESVMIIERSSGNERQSSGSRISHPHQIGSAAIGNATITNSSMDSRNPLAMLRQLDPAKSMPTNISLQATHSPEDEGRPASVMILENPRDNPTPKFNIGNVVSLAPGYNNNRLYGNASAASFVPPPPAQAHLLQDITSSCCCNVCNDIRSGDLIRRAQIMIQAGHYEYKCPMCIRRFAHKSSLLRHTRSFNHGFVCDLCSSGFLGQASFECHKRLHKEKSCNLPTGGGLSQSATVPAVNQQMANQHPGNRQMMHPPPPPLLSSMNRRLLLNSGNNSEMNPNQMSPMMQQKQAQTRRPENNAMMQMANNSRNAQDDDVIVVGIERRQQVSRPMARTLPPPPPLGRAPRPNMAAANNRMMQERLNMSAFPASTLASNMSRNAMNNLSQRGCNMPTKVMTSPSTPQSQLARIFNNSEITLTPIGNEGNARRFEGITITPTSQTNPRHIQIGNANTMARHSVGQVVRPRVQLIPRNNNNNMHTRFASPVISNVRHIAQPQPNSGRVVSMSNMNHTAFTSNANRQGFNPQMQNTRMPMRSMPSTAPTRANVSSSIANNQYMSQLSNTMRQNAHGINNNPSSRAMLASRSETGTHTAYRMMPVTNPSIAQNRQPSQQAARPSLPMWHHPVSTEAYSANAMAKNNSAVSLTQNIGSAISISTTQANSRASIQSMSLSASTALPSSNQSSGPNRFPIPPVQQVHVPTSNAVQFVGQANAGNSFQHSSPSQIAQTKDVSTLPQAIGCPFCNMNFNSAAAFQEHYKLKHKGNNPPNLPSSTLPCSRCQKQFSDSVVLKEHESICQEKVPCIRCNVLISHDKWASHCAEFHIGETQDNLSTITITNPFESSNDSNTQPAFVETEVNNALQKMDNENDGTSAADNAPQALQDNDIIQHGSATVDQSTLSMSPEAKYIDSHCNSSDNGRHSPSSNVQTMNSEMTTDDDVLVHDLSLAAASEIQLINDTVMDISGNGDEKMSTCLGDAQLEANEDCKVSEELTNFSDSDSTNTVVQMPSTADVEPNSAVPNDSSDLPNIGADIAPNNSSDTPNIATDDGANGLNPDETKSLDDCNDLPPNEDGSVESSTLVASDPLPPNEDGSVESSTLVVPDALLCSEPSKIDNLEQADPESLDINMPSSLKDDTATMSSSSDDGDDRIDSIDNENSNEADNVDQTVDEILNSEDNEVALPSRNSSPNELISNSDENLSHEHDEFADGKDTDTKGAIMDEKYEEDDNFNANDMSEIPCDVHDDNDFSSSNVDEEGTLSTEQNESSAVCTDESDIQTDQDCKPQLAETSKTFICPICDQIFNSKKQFLLHIEIHQSPVQHICHLCKDKFGTKKELVLHLRSHMKSCSKTRRSSFSRSAVSAKRPRRDSGDSPVRCSNSSAAKSKLMVALLDLDKVAASVGLLQRLGVVGLISLNDLQLHLSGSSLPSDNSEEGEIGGIPIVNLSSD